MQNGLWLTKRLRIERIGIAERGEWITEEMEFISYG